MKQKVSVRACIKQNGKILLIKRAAGNESLIGKYELPGGKLELGEQPVDAIKRELKEELGVETEVVQLYDAITHVDETDPDFQHFIVVYQVSLAPYARKIVLSEDHNRYVWQSMIELQRSELTETSNMILNVVENTAITDKINIDLPKHDDLVTTNNRLIIYSDGGSRGNPGPSAAGFVVMNLREEVLFEGGKYLGITTNNQAEYQAVCLGLEKAREIGALIVDFRIDSLLVVNQLTGIYQIKNRELWPVHSRIKEMITHFEKVSFRHVKREFNTLADGMVNKVLDRRATVQQK